MFTIDSFETLQIDLVCHTNKKPFLKQNPKKQKLRELEKNLTSVQLSQGFKKGTDNHIFLNPV